MADGTTPTADISSFTPEQQAAFLAAAQQAGSTGIQVTSTGGTQTVSEQTSFTPEDLSGAASPVQVPQVNPPTTADTSQIDQQITQVDQQRDTAEQDYQQSSQTLADRVMGLIQKGGTEATRKAELEAQAGIPELNKTANELIQQIRSNNAAAFAETQRQEDRLAPTFAIMGAQAQVERQRAVRNYGLAAAVEAINGNITVAQDNIQRALDQEFGQVEAELAAAKFMYDVNKDEFDRIDKKLSEKANRFITERERIISTMREDRNAALSLIPQIAGLADTTTINRVLSAKTLDEAMRYAAPYLNSEETQVVKLDDGNTVLINSQTGEIIKNYGGAKPPDVANSFADGISAPYGSQDYLTQLFSNSRGGQSLTASQIEPITKATIVLDQLGDLSTQINSIDTGPLLGILRNNNPYDAKARAIKATLQATVPNLARGVYGEVGVLTDTDIANYIKTLPNAQETGKTNDLILAMTLNVVANSIGATLETYANGGRDVSGYVNQYNALIGEIERIRREAGGEVDDQGFGAEYDEQFGGTSGIISPATPIVNFFSKIFQ